MQMIFGRMAAAVLLTGSVLCSTLSAEETATASPRGEISVESKLERTREILKGNHEEKDKAPAGEKVEDDLGKTGFRLMKGLLLCLGVFAIGIYIAKRLGLKPAVAGGKKIRILDRAALTPRSSLVLVEAEGKSVLVAVGSEHVALLEVKDAAMLGAAIDAYDRGAKGT